MNWEDITLPTIESLNAQLEEHKAARMEYINIKRKLFDDMFAQARINIMQRIKDLLEISMVSYKAPKYIILKCNEGVTEELQLPLFTSNECFELYEECYPKESANKNNLYECIMVPIVAKLKNQHFTVNVQQYCSVKSYIIMWD